MPRPERKDARSYVNLDALAGRPTGTCCYGCAKREDCPMEAVGRKCTRDPATCTACSWWNERGCFCFEIDRKFLKM